MTIQDKPVLFSIMTSHGADFLFVIDTNTYAGNFEREMCAYITGMVGDCEVGEEMAELFRKDYPNGNLFENIAYVPDEDNGCRRPVTIWPTPGWGNDGMGNEYRIANADQKELCTTYVKEVKAYANSQIKYHEYIISGLKKGQDVGVGWTIEDAEKEIIRHQKDIDEAKKLKKVACYPAYNSVGIWFDIQPSEEEIKITKERALKFIKIYPTLDGYNAKIKIEGFRLLSFETKEKEIKI